ncbi:MAG TPA: STAS/SEC14 domain-containing protein [Kineosporiaceae bacterium]|nr:STAS/SEC14 domain-containing protein [Kineosporiaceae bacterium]
MPIITEPTDYGYRAVFLDPVTVSDIQGWVPAVEGAVAGRTAFGQLVDLRQDPQAGRDQEVTHALRDAAAVIRKWGLHRSAAIVADQITARRLMRLVHSYLPGTGERFVDGRHPDWEAAALAWIRHGVEPFETLTPIWQAARFA